MKTEETASSVPPISTTKNLDGNIMPGNMNMLSVGPNAINMPNHMPMFNPWMQANIMPVPFPSPAPWPLQVAPPPVIPPGYQLIPLGDFPATPVHQRHHARKRSRQLAELSSAISSSCIKEFHLFYFVLN